MSYMTLEVKNLYKDLKNLNIDFEHIDLITTSFRQKTIVTSARKLGKF